MLSSGYTGTSVYSTLSVRLDFFLVAFVIHMLLTFMKLPLSDFIELND